MVLSKSKTHKVRSRPGSRGGNSGRAKSDKEVLRRMNEIVDLNAKNPPEARKALARALRHDALSSDDANAGTEQPMAPQFEYLDGLTGEYRQPHGNDLPSRTEDESGEVDRQLADSPVDSVDGARALPMGNKKSSNALELNNLNEMVSAWNLKSEPRPQRGHAASHRAGRRI